MPPEPYFESSVPPRTETYSFRKKPCRFEPNSQRNLDPDLAGVINECPFLEVCESTAGGMQPLTSVYGEHIKVTLSEPSSTLVVRSEHQYNKNERMRMSLRKHIYELNIDRDRTFILRHGTIEGICHVLAKFGQQVVDSMRPFLSAFIPVDKKEYQFPTESAFIDLVNTQVEKLALPEPERSAIHNVIMRYAGASLRCSPIVAGKNGDRFGRYLGFIDLRLNSPRAPIAMGLLVPPRHLRHNKDAFVVVGEYSHLFGAPGFASTVYVMQDPDQGGAYCAQACLIMALATLADRSILIAGSYSLAFLGKERRPATSTDPQSCAFTLQGAAGVESSFTIGGMKFGEMSKVFRTPGFGTNASEIRLPPSAAHDYLAARLIEAHAHARCPVILCVDSKKIYGRQERGQGHAVMVVGHLRTPQHVSTCVPRITDVLVHDPGMLPFMRIPIGRALHATREFADKDDAFADHVHMLAITDAKIRRHAINAIHELPLFMNARDVLLYAKYIMATTAATACQTDYRISLVHRDDIETNQFRPFCSGASKETRQLLESSVSRLTNGRYWALAGFEKGRLEVLWIFDAEDQSAFGMSPDTPGSFVPWQLRIFIPITAEPEVQMSERVVAS